MHAEKKLADFNLAVRRHTAKPPNFSAIRYYDFVCSCGAVYCGDVFGESVGSGSLATVSVDAGGRATLHTVSQQLHVWDLIGRSIVVRSPQNR